ncbi:MAG: VanZ family protein [Saprospiraceae bacterium]|nr:VanZ family protein [Saprospiraceae bacterium]
MRYNYAAAFWSLLILGLSLMPGKSLPKVGWQMFIHLDKLAHFIIYGVLAGLLVLTHCKTASGRVGIKDLGYVILICTIYGAILEAMQYFFLSDRFFEIPDIIANIIGSIAGTVFVYLFLKR